MKPIKKLCLILGLVGLLLPQSLSGQTPEPVVHAVLFFSPTCPHCHEVISETLIPLQDQYENRLVLMGMDTSQEWGGNLYMEAVRHYEIPQAEWSVPLLIVGEEVLIGGNVIPARFPAMVEEGLAAGGIDLPSYPALVTFLREQDLLDPRYPDRLIAVVIPSDEGDPTPEAGDSARVDETPAPRDSTVVADSGAVVDSAVSVAPVEVMDSVAVVEPGSGVDSVPSSDSTAVVDSTVPAVSAEVETSADAGEERGSEEVVPDPILPSTGGTDQQQNQDTVTPGPGAEAAPEAVGGLGLEEAVRELESMTMWDRFNMDRTGNSLSVLVLIIMLVSLALRGYPPRVKGGEWPSWVIPTLVVLGAGVAAYLTYIEVTQTEAVCGPVGDCNTVNQSKYAFLFGFLPVGVFGLVGYGTILVLWVLRRTGTGDYSRLSTLGLWSASLFGTLFSVYLTFLEPFVIGATCAWCLTSAIVMTLLLWATAPLAAQSWRTEEVTHASS